MRSRFEFSKVVIDCKGFDVMKIGEPSYTQFWEAYYIIMNMIDRRENTRGLFHALFNLGLDIRKEEEEE